ncbi:hypothetical protein HPP92_015561 [Vanilla planifolia]|uniref:Uncharacterized protein n=1 Tax=Vanilla planifolia TaxID=51239 RepID=A0A835QJE9_VANPL|nr:hypothetical protein HPP92_015561 [Vanilla planifolia]
MTYLIWQWLWFCQKVEQKKEKPAWLVARFCGRNCIIVRVYESVSDLPFVEWGRVEVINAHRGNSIYNL